MLAHAVSNQTRLAEKPADFTRAGGEGIWKVPSEGFSRLGIQDGDFAVALESKHKEARDAAQKWLSLYRSGDFGGGTASTGSSFDEGGMT